MSSELLAEFKKNRLFGGLDGLRFLSIVAVVWHHSVQSGEWPNIAARGFLGVDLFFVISGFLIVTLLLRERDKTGSISLRNFYIRRALRIFPLYYGVILGLVLIYYLFNRGSPYGESLVSELPIYLLYLANIFPVVFGIAWSLSSEEQFYLLWPFLEKYFARNIFFALLVLIALNQLVNFFRVPLFASIGAQHLSDLSIMQATFTPILLGVLLAHVLHEGVATRWLLPLIDKKYSSFFWFVALLVIIELSPQDISGIFRLIIQVVMVMFVGSTVIREDHYLNHVLTFKPLARIGAISYGIYLFHIHGIAAAQKILHKINVYDQILVFLLSMVIVVIVAELSFRFFETPFLKLKSRFSLVHQGHV